MLLYNKLGAKYLFQGLDSDDNVTVIRHQSFDRMFSTVQSITSNTVWISNPLPFALSYRTNRYVKVKAFTQTLVWSQHILSTLLLAWTHKI